jgi:hypothetical protein
MNRNNISKFIGLLAFVLTVSSCNEGGDVAPIVDVNKPTMTIDMASAVTVAEGTEIPVTFNLTSPVGKEFSLYIMLLPGSTAGGTDSDVEESYQNNAFQKTVVIPPFVTSYTTSILINEDVDAEGLEHLMLSIGDTRTTAVLFTPKNVDVSITNVVKDELDLYFNFDRSFGVNGYTNTLCKLTSSVNTNTYFDVDFIVYDENFNDLPITDAQTGACTEHLTMKLADFTDGTYYITAYLYQNANLPSADLSFPFLGMAQFNIPITVDYSRAGSFSGVYTQEAENFFNSNSAVDSENYLMTVVISTVNGARKFTVQNSAGIVSGMGRMANQFNHIRTKK